MPVHYQEWQTDDLRYLVVSEANFIAYAIFNNYAEALSWMSKQFAPGVARIIVW